MGKHRYSRGEMVLVHQDADFEYYVSEDETLYNIVPRVGTPVRGYHEKKTPEEMQGVKYPPRENWRNLDHLIGGGSTLQVIVPLGHVTFAAGKIDGEPVVITCPRQHADKIHAHVERILKEEEEKKDE